MIACKLAAMVPERVLSLALLNVTGGGFECFPKVTHMALFLESSFFDSYMVLFICVVGSFWFLICKK